MVLWKQFIKCESSVYSFINIYLHFNLVFFTNISPNAIKWNSISMFLTFQIIDFKFFNHLLLQIECFCFIIIPDNLNNDLFSFILFSNEWYLKITLITAKFNSVVLYWSSIYVSMIVWLMLVKHSDKFLNLR